MGVRMASAILVSFWLSSVTLIAVGAWLVVNVQKLPIAVNHFLLYGKVKATKGKSRPLSFMEIPKRWFYHFYTAGALANGYMLYNLVSTYFLGQEPCQLLDKLLTFFTPQYRTPTIDAGTATLLVLMMALQVVRRLLECLFVSVYSKSSMNIAHYLLAMILYSTFPYSVLAEAPDWKTYRVHDVKSELLKWNHVTAVALFTWASFHHNQATVAFARLRKNSQGEVTDLQHHIPQGGWFKYVSCPHYLMETVIYMSMVIASGFAHLTVLSIFVFVLGNQCIAAYLTHKWYLGTYPAYPKDRKAIIPYLL